MSQQLVLSINSNADAFRWCWLQDGKLQSSDAGDLDALRNAVQGITQSVWLLLPGTRVVTRELEYTEKEKKHLRNLLPFQLEDAVIGDIDELHFALGTAAKGRVALAYTNKKWLTDIFKQLSELGLEIMHCWSTPSVLPLKPAVIEPTIDEQGEIVDPIHVIAATQEQPAATWTLALEDGLVNLRFDEQQGFSLSQNHFGIALALLIEARGMAENPPYLVLSAVTQGDLDQLFGLLPASLKVRVAAQNLVDEWQFDFNGNAIDLCQAEFSQRLPLERWWKLWRDTGILALITLVVFIATIGFHIHKLNKQNLVLRQQIESVFRTVVQRGPADNPEKSLRIKLAELQPKNQAGSVVNLLAGVLPVVSSNTDITVKLITYSADTGELSINVQAHSFNSIDGLRQAIVAKGFSAELLTANAQGDVNSGRLKITKPSR